MPTTVYQIFNLTPIPCSSRSSLGMSDLIAWANASSYCWVCTGPWNGHGPAWYSCHRYDKKTGVGARDAQIRSSASLERYLHVRRRSAV
ncbi:hypothetical protein CPC08DRAFT_710374 [Agrocybe pediades]|nr:hypothetical protein CPC08DRAFT_710374 [Agrocybe pediades]